jgi:stearoyl-CoA desaturase (delta-9 desaturase)
MHQPDIAAPAPAPTQSLSIGAEPSEARAPHEPGFTVETPLRVRIVTIIAVVLPLLGLIAAIVLLWGVAVYWIDIALLASMYLLTGFGITVGFHRYFTHRSFTTARPMAYLLAILGSMAVQGPLLQWVAVHRRHHQHSDEEGDPHSPHLHGDTLMGALRGLYHAHIGWMIAARHHPVGRYVGDLRRDKGLCLVSRLFPLWVALGILVPTLIAGLVTMSWTGALSGFLWGGLARIFLGHHITWSINSVCHIWGARPFDCGDESRNNPIFGVLAFGEGWHNNHHAFPTSARHGLRWWEFDSSYLLIRALALARLARGIKVPSPERIAAKLADSPD